MCEVCDIEEKARDMVWKARESGQINKAEAGQLGEQIDEVGEEARKELEQAEPDAIKKLNRRLLSMLEKLNEKPATHVHRVGDVWEWRPRGDKATEIWQTIAVHANGKTVVHRLIGPERNSMGPIGREREWPIVNFGQLPESEPYWKKWHFAGNKLIEEKFASDNQDDEEEGEESMAKASEKNKYEDASVTRSEETAQIVLPRDMSLAEARNWLTRQEEMENTKIAVTNVFEGVYPIEGAYALLRYLQQKYGFVDAVATPTLFGEDPPTFVGVEVEPGKIVQVPWGRLQLNGIDGYLEAGVHLNKREKTCCFTLNGEVRRKSEEKVKELVADLKVYIRDNSIFRGKAFQIEFPDKDDRFQIDPSYLPRLLNVSNVNEEELTFDDEIREMVEDTVFSLVEHTETARRLQIPRKRGILLEGPFGTGKTLTAFVLAKKATANGWTYIYVKRAADIDRAVGMARQYQPCVVFCEDVDTAATVNRTEDVNSILNTMDGIDSKDGEVMVVVTTNVVSSITKAMLRPGRIDTVIPIRPPGARAAQKLLRIYGRGLIDEEVTLDKVGEELNGRIPAFIRETVERAKLSAIRHVMAGERLVLTERDLLTAARSMKYQIELLEETPRKVYDDPQVEAADVLGQHVATAIRGAAASVISAARPEKAMNGASSHHTPSITDGL